MIFIGDIHGDFDKLWPILRDKDEQYVQVGDLGLGFPPYLNVANGKAFKRDPKKFPGNFRFIRGNHDNPEACEKYPNYLGDYGIEPNGKFFFVSGAWSIDRSVRTEGVDMWEREEMSSSKLHEAILSYDKSRPQVMVTHTCPTEIARMIMSPGRVAGSRTENALLSMWEIHKPALWIFGHWHNSWNKNVLGTHFRCLNSNETFEISL